MSEPGRNVTLLSPTLPPAEAVEVKRVTASKMDNSRNILFFIVLLELP
jgi:hypothetical protein